MKRVRSILGWAIFVCLVLPAVGGLGFWGMQQGIVAVATMDVIPGVRLPVAAELTRTVKTTVIVEPDWDKPNILLPADEEVEGLANNKVAVVAVRPDGSLIGGLAAVAPQPFPYPGNKTAE